MWEQLLKLVQGKHIYLKFHLKCHSKPHQSCNMKEALKICPRMRRISKKEFFEMTQMVKVLYEERNSRLQGEISNPPKGNGGNGGEPPKGDGGNGDKPPPPPPPPFSSPSSSPSSSSTPTPSQTPPHSRKGHDKYPLLKLYIKFEFPMYNGEVH